MDDLGLPDVALARYDARVVLPDAGEPEVHGTGRQRRMLNRAVAQAARDTDRAGAPHVGPWDSSLDAGAYRDALARIHELLARG